MDLNLLTPFIDSTCSILGEMAGIELSQTDQAQNQEGAIDSFGVASILSFSGKIKGRFVLDMTPELAEQAARTMLGELDPNERIRMMAAAVSEINNIICGDANTALNNNYGYNLRLVPPIVFTGKGMTVSVAQIDSMTAIFSSAGGALKINVGFCK